MPGTESSFFVDITGDRSWNWTDISNLEVRAAAKASANNTVSNADVRLRTDGTVTSNPTIIESCTGFSGITETSSGEYALDFAQSIVTTSSGTGTCDIYSCSY